MRSTTIRIPEELIDRLEEESEERGVSRSEYIRQILEDRHEAVELRETIEDLRERLDSRDQRISDLEEQLARRSNIEDEIEELALEIREQRHHGNAPFLVKWIRWWRERD